MIGAAWLGEFIGTVIGRAAEIAGPTLIRLWLEPHTYVREGESDAEKRDRAALAALDPVGPGASAVGVLRGADNPPRSDAFAPSGATGDGQGLGSETAPVRITRAGRDGADVGDVSRGERDRQPGRYRRIWQVEDKAMDHG